ncbi:MAG TPA: GGDEF domain-containing protein [Candidatus Omnitrophota bacterium]|nr:GGDEF domain-containing protein [Candidatus Omnitrophota bacterium]
MQTKFFHNRIRTIIISISLIFIIGDLDYMTGYQLGFSIFYLIPICLVTWFIGREAGLTMSALGLLVWVLADYFAHPEPPSLLVTFWNALVRMGFFIIVTLLLARIKLSLEKEKRLSRIDFLTGIANRHEFENILHLEMERSRRHKRPLTLAYLDCDNFKTINDQLGHQQGDLLLKELANSLARNTRKIDKIARLGGDEFVILLPETAEQEGREIFLRLQVKLLTIMELYKWPVTFSIGAVTFYDMPLSTLEAIREADHTMYQAKVNGKNQLITKAIHSFITKQ